MWDLNPRPQPRAAKTDLSTSNLKEQELLQEGDKTITR
jgi:hypothetical protein